MALDGGLTPKQEAFVLAYHEDRDASAAAKDAGIELSLTPPKSDAYVYLLLCPAMKRIIYVGKGRRQRMHAHMKEARTGKLIGMRKHRAIREYTIQGLNPVAVVFQDGLTDDKALALEKAVVFAIGPRIVANTMACTGNKYQRALQQNLDMVREVKPFCQFMREHDFDIKKMEFYAWWCLSTRELRDDCYKHV